MSTLETCPECGKDLSALSMQARYGHVGGHKRKKMGAKPASPGGNASPPPAQGSKVVHKAVFSAKVTPQEDLQDYQKPKDVAATPKASTVDRGEAIEGLISLGLERWNDYVASEATVSGGPPKISKEEIKALAVGVRDVLEKHGGLEGVEGIGEYLPEISLLIAAGLIGMKMVAGLRYKAGKRGGTMTAGTQALRSENPDQSTAKAYEIFNRPEVKAEIEEAMKNSRVGE